MTALIIFLAIFVLAGLASALGWTPDSRDPRFTVGRLLDSPRPAGSHRGG